MPGYTQPAPGCLPTVSIFNPDESYLSVETLFTPPLSETGPVKGILELADPITACNLSGTLTNDFDGNIAIIDRGECSFVHKILNAQDAGASAVIVCNNREGGFTMDGRPLEPVIIPAVSMTMEDCQSLKLHVGGRLKSKSAYLSLLFLIGGLSHLEFSP